MNSPFSDPAKFGAHPKDMRRVILESPFRGGGDLYIEYARACLRDCLFRGESPLASHLLYTQPGVLNDDDPIERAQGINAGHAWMHIADAVVVYADYGISEGMRAGISTASFHGVPIEYRKLEGIKTRR